MSRPTTVHERVNEALARVLTNTPARESLAAAIHRALPRITREETRMRGHAVEDAASRQIVADDAENYAVTPGGRVFRIVGGDSEGITKAVALPVGEGVRQGVNAIVAQLEAGQEQENAGGQDRRAARAHTTYSM
jgi:hypothetical protein